MELIHTFKSSLVGCAGPSWPSTTFARYSEKGLMGRYKHLREWQGLKICVGCLHQAQHAKKLRAVIWALAGRCMST